MKSTAPTWALRTKADDEAIRQGCYWDAAKANAIVKFAEAFFKSQYIAGTFKLLEWQRRLLMSLYGWRMPDSSRRFRFATLHTGKKCGKTLITAIVSLFELYCSEKPSPFICVCAASKENASQVFSEIKYSLDHGPLRGTATVTPHTKKIELPELNGKLWTLASDGKRVHGYHASLVIFDEAHATRDAELYRALRYATIARQGLMFIISTAGNDSTHWYHSIYTKAKRIQDGEDLDIAHYAEVHESDPDADPEDPIQWHRACPSLGISYSVEDYARELRTAKNSSVADWLIFQQLMLNRWVRPSETSWLDVSDYMKWKKDYPEDVLARCPATMGIDLSETVCPTSVSTCFDLGNGSYFLQSKGWITRGGIEQRQKTKLPQFEEFDPHLEIMDGDRLDPDTVLSYVIEQGRRFDIRQINFDPRSAYVLGGRIEDAGFTIARYQQSPRNFDGPMRSFEANYKAGNIHHDGNLWLKYCLSNVRLEVNKYGEIAPRASKSVDFIDGAVAALLAYHSAVQPEERITTGITWV